MSPTNVAVIGVGLVGKELLSQLSRFSSDRFRIVYVSSSSRSRYSTTGISLSSWSDELSSSTDKPDLPSLPHLLKDVLKTGHKTVVVDNTSSDDVAALYPSFLKAGLHIVTPNKKAFSSSLNLYEEIKKASQESGAKFLNEATVGAGLPIVGTLKDLVETGDEVYKIEGVLSGTLSYIFNEFSSVKENAGTFASVVKIAKENGYTEPHPEDDLSGFDVSRKLTILSRLIPSLESSLPDGFKSVSTTSLVPKELQNIPSGDEFVKRLPEFDAHFDDLKKKALDEGNVLRYVGVIDVKKGEIKAELQKYPITHPFATSLGGSDNIIAFHTKRYGARPLIVQGAGAGAAVTAMGVLGDLLKI